MKGRRGGGRRRRRRDNGQEKGVWEGRGENGEQRRTTKEGEKMDRRTGKEEEKTLRRRDMGGREEAREGKQRSDEKRE